MVHGTWIHGLAYKRFLFSQDLLGEDSCSFLVSRWTQDVAFFAVREHLMKILYRTLYQILYRTLYPIVCFPFLLCRDGLVVQMLCIGLVVGQKCGPSTSHLICRGHIHSCQKHGMIGAPYP